MDHRLNTTTAPIGAPVVGAPVAPVGATTFVDPRPPLKVEKEKAHDFEVHREGAYAKGKTFPSKEVAAAPTDAVAIGAQPHTMPTNTAAVAGAPYVAPGAPYGAAVAVDPRPPLPIEKEKVHDFEAHREGGHVKGHTKAGAAPTGVGLVNVPGGPAGYAAPGSGIAPGAPYAK